MRILFALDKYSRAEGGADRFARGAAERLAAAGHAVRVLEAGPRDAPPQDRNGVTVRVAKLPRPWLFRDGDWRELRWNILWHEIVAAELAAHPADRVLTQNMLAPATLAAAKRAGVRTALFFHGYRPLSPTFFEGQDALATDPPAFGNVSWRVRCKWPLVAKRLELQEKAFRAADTVVANSEYAARVIRRFCGREAEVAYPVTDLVDIPIRDRARPDGPVLCVKPERVKGVETMLAVARRLPEVPFLFVGRARRAVRRRLAALPNAEHRGWVSDLEPVYAACSVVFGPSRIPEPFGRAFLEAAMRGLPSVASAFGGIPEAVGEGGILLPFDAAPEAWADAIRRVRDPETHAELASRARAHAQDLLSAHNPGRLLRILDLA